MSWLIVTLIVICLSDCMEGSAVSSKPQWWKGNTHTHTFWSDGKEFPEVVAQWYKRHGYNFLALTDHNILSQGEKWSNVRNKEPRAYPGYLKHFGPDWVETRTVNGKKQVRVKPLNEFRHLLEEPGSFMFIQGEELTPRGSKHVNAINTVEKIGGRGGETNTELLQNNINAVLEQEKRTGQQMLSHVNHPNWKWALTADDIMPLVGTKFFEFYNGGGTSCNNIGDENHVSTERMWDIILAMRLGVLDLPVIYGVATDDAHEYYTNSPKVSSPGRAWVVVRSTHLTPEYIINAMNAGDFYASNGVTLKDVQFDGKTLKVKIDAEFGVSYTTHFIGTKKNFDTTTTEHIYKGGGKNRTTKIYSDEIGMVLKETKGSVAEYTLTGDELYVRATVTSSKLKHNPHFIGELEMAWTQPVLFRSTFENK